MAEAAIEKGVACDTATDCTDALGNVTPVSPLMVVDMHVTPWEFLRRGLR
jgi:hypothetical protein